MSCRTLQPGSKLDGALERLAYDLEQFHHAKGLGKKVLADLEFLGVADF